MKTRKSFVGRFFNENINKIESLSHFRFIKQIIKKLRTFGVKEKFIIQIIEKIINTKYHEYISVKNIWIKISSDFNVFHELIDPEARILFSSIYINIPIIFLKKRSVVFWKIKTKPEVLIKTTLGQKHHTIYEKHSFFIDFLDSFIGEYVKIKNLRDLLSYIKKENHKFTIIKITKILDKKSKQEKNHRILKIKEDDYTYEFDISRYIPVNIENLNYINDTKSAFA